MNSSVTLGILAFIGYLAAALLLPRVVRRSSPARAVAGASVFVYAILLLAVSGSGLPVRFWPLSAAYWFPSLCFLVGFGAIYKSISMRILGDLLVRPSRSARYEEILYCYVATESYDARLQVLLTEGLATREPAGFRLTPKGHRIASAVQALHRLFGIERIG